MQNNHTSDSRSQIFVHLVKLIAEKQKIPPLQIRGHSHLQDQLGMNSLEVVELIIEVENAYDISIPPVEQKRLRTLNDMVVIIDKLKEN